MYRRRNQKQAQAQTQPEQVVEKKEEKKEEPVIKYVVQPRSTTYTQIGTVPMLNTLRNFNYFNIATKTNIAVPYNYVVDTLLSPGYLAANFQFYNTDGAETDPKAFTASINKWSDLYENTTNYNRSTFAPGDLIMFQTGYTESDNRGNFTVGFLIDKIYKASSSDSGFEEDRRLNYDPPKELENKKNAVTSNFNVKLSSLNDCNGVVYMFKQDVELENIKTFISYKKDQVTGEEKYDELRKLEPTNVSVYDHVNSTVVTDAPNWGSVSRKESDDEKFLPSSKPTALAEGATNTDQFNLTSGTIVDGWIIYMTSSASSLDSTADITLANVQTITGDVVKTEKVAITTIGNKILSIDNVFQVPFATTKQVKYCGNSTRFASEPLNSEQYQVKYGDTVGERGIPISSQAIYSLKRCVGETGTTAIPDY